MTPRATRRKADGLPERILVVRCPRWPLRALGVDDHRPAAVVAGGVVVASTAGAAAEGVLAGLRRRDAEACCPTLAVLARDAAAERRAFEPVVAALEAFGVPVTVRAPGWAALATRGPARRLGGEEGLVGATTAALARIRLPGAPRGDDPAPARSGGAGERWWRIGVADGAFAASLAAVRGLVVERGATAAFLAPLAIERLGRPELAAVLRRLGIETLGAFAALEADAVQARFGREGALCQELAAGREGARLAGRPPARPAQAEKRLDPPASQLEATLFVARGLADELAGSLRRRGLACGLLAVEVHLGDGSRLERRWSGRASCAPGLVAERLRAQLEAWGARRRTEDPPEDVAPVEVVAVRLVALEVVADGGDQRSLWGRQRPADDERVARAVARLDGLLGQRRVLRVVSGGGRGPAERARWLAFDEPPPGESPHPAPWPGRLPGPSPAVVPPTAPPAAVLDARGATVAVDARGALSAAPARVAVGAGPTRAVQAWAGPFPADERWWEGSRRRRRARLQVVLAGGEAYLLSLERGAWTVEGGYD